MHCLLPAPCPYPPCGHSILEHYAWEAGWAAGAQGDDADTCPMDGVMAEAWLCGHSAVYCIAPMTPQDAQEGTHERRGEE